MEASTSNLVPVHPNRERTSSQATKAVITGLLIASAALTALIFVAGFSKLEGMRLVDVIYVLLYLLMAYLVSRWSRGTLAMASGAAILLLSAAILAVPTWFARSKAGFDSPLLPSALLGLLTLTLVFVQIALIVFAMIGFRQQWNIEVEVSEEEAEGGVDPGKFDESGQRIDDEEDDDSGHGEDGAEGHHGDEDAHAEGHHGDEDAHDDGHHGDEEAHADHHHDGPRASADGGEPSDHEREGETSGHASSSEDGDGRSGDEAEASRRSGESRE